MPVALLPPTTNSGGAWSGQTPLTEAPRYIRGRGNSRWHRVRSAVIYPAGHVRAADVTIYHYWCGPSGGSSGKAGPLWLVDDLPPGEPVCGTCVGRALGAGQDDTPAGLPPLLFSPRWQSPPTVCPGSNKQDLMVALNQRITVGQCLVCGAIERVHALGRGYNAYGYGLIKHAPGEDLANPCPFHAWSQLVERKGQAVCRCGWPGNAS
ncbi:hypothetical protein ABT369_38610 [Dactylosporangium sp. NPDC000244]|uniref:hypothetical protein n=1 Tax=Dactylosporangium sp. NPDC000244 TaxID=3154365 RepID=UPI0033228CF2